MSVAMRAVALYVRLTGKKSFATSHGMARMLADPKGPSAPPAKLRTRHRVSQRSVAGFDVWSLSPKSPPPVQRVVVYIHGGAYVGEISPQHWQLIDRFVSAGMRVEVPIYGLAPQHTYREAYRLLDRVYRDLLLEMPADSVVLAGDSAGGGLALGFAQGLLASQMPRPRRLVLLAPWLDIELLNPQVPDAEAKDPWLARVGLVEAGRAWSGGDEPTDPRLSPINGRLTGLPPIHVYIGTRDLFHPDALLLAARAKVQGVPVELRECEGAVHVYPLTPTPEGRTAASEIVTVALR